MTNERDDDLASQLADLFFRSQGTDSVFGIMRRVITEVRDHDATHGILRAQPLTAEQRAEMQAILRGDAPGFLETENPEDRWIRDTAGACPACGSGEVGENANETRYCRRCGWNDDMPRACPAGGGSGGEGWRPIESAPKDGTRVLLWTTTAGDSRLTEYLRSCGDDEDVSLVQTGWFEGPTEGWSMATIGRPTHWQPLPAPPAAHVPETSAEPPALPVGTLTGVRNAASDVTQERLRQIEVEGWTPEHDDRHADGAIAKAAASYAISSAQYPKMRGQLPPVPWPWDLVWWKPTDRRRDLVKAGALILAEIERLDRLAAAEPPARSGEEADHG